MSQLAVARLLAHHRRRFVAMMQLQQQIHLSRCRQQQQQQTKNASGVVQASFNSQSDVSTEVRPLGETIKENTKTASYTAIILAGIGVTGIMIYTIFSELFSSSSPNNIYSNALERVKDNPRVQDCIGAPIKGFGEASRRGRRQHVAHHTFERNGVPHMRMQFYIQGMRNKATVHLESRKGPSGGIEYRYLFVQLDHYPRTTIIIEDNRASDPQPVTDFSNLELSGFTQK